MPDLRKQFTQSIRRLLTPISNLFSKKQNTVATSKHLAMAQVLQAKQTRKMPSKGQLLHFTNLLSHKEKTIAGVCLLAIILSVAYLALSLIGTKQQIVPVAGGSYTEGLIGSPQLINPLYSLTGDVDTDLASIIYSGLMKFNASEGVTPDLAESYTISEDQKQYTFTIRDNAKWQDGDPVLTNDVIFTVSAILNTQYRSPLATSFGGITVSQVDERTVRFDLEKASPDFLNLMTVGILPSHIWQDIPPANSVLTAFNIKPIGSGPYAFEMFEKDSKSGEILSYTVKRFNDYYLDGPYIETITFKFYPDLTSAVSALKNHNIEGISYLPIEDAVSFEKDDHIAIQQAGLHEYVALFFNQNSDSATDDVLVRKALSYATYKERIIDEVFNGYAKQMESFVLPGTIGYSEDVSDLLFDQKYATVLLGEAGWIINPESGMRTKDDETLSLTITTLDAQELQDVANVIKSQWEELGIQVEIKTVDQATLQSDTLKNHNYDILLSGEVYNLDLNPYAFWHSTQTGESGLNLSLYKNDDVDDLLETAQESKDAQEKAGALIEAQKLVNADYPAIFLYQPQYTYAISGSINNANIDRIHIPADRFSSINSWFIKTKKSFTTQ
ncbi:hypothetical protein KJ673_00480 [Patescibacteria group bacterium]|nr:hypothetical protein [Patescibacteria group bacterium]MCG2688010.1 ABC transporter substrate-binding protein [Candidatus Parcubacteria bacterium]